MGGRGLGQGWRQGREGGGAGSGLETRGENKCKHGEACKRVRDAAVLRSICVLSLSCRRRETGEMSGRRQGYPPMGRC